MKLTVLLKGIYDGEIPHSFYQTDIKELCVDSRLANDQCLFFALKGTQKDGAFFIPDAIKRGVKVIIKSSRSECALPSDDICLLNVEDPRRALLEISNRFFGYPSQKIKPIGITGTNGKTTITYLIESILRAAGLKCAVIGTVNYRVGKKVFPSKNTTPGLLENQQLLARMVKQKARFCVMEVSSHALDQGRVDAIAFNTAVFTNLTHDHMDYHLTMDRYFEAKAKLFTKLGADSTAVINQDDDYGKKLLRISKGKILSYGVTDRPSVKAQDIQMRVDGTEFTMNSKSGRIKVRTSLIGKHNIYNILAAASACLSQKIDIKKIRKGIAQLKGVPGRLERVENKKGLHVFVDYAHTDDALKNVLTSLKELQNHRIILVFGCGGDRDRTKRPKMGAIAGQLADFTYVTSDNPRSEDPHSITQEIIPGFKRNNFEVVLDRKEAIRKALTSAQKGEVVLIAGKGHENYQIFKDRTIHFDDREVVRKVLGC